MGCGESVATAQDPKVFSQVDDRAISKLPETFEKQEFQEARSHLQMSESLTLLRSIARDLTKKPPLTSVPATLDKACFICCNTYTVPKYTLGVGPTNDAITIAANHKQRGYQVFFIYNPTPKEFLDFLPLFLSRTKKELTVYYTGNGALKTFSNADNADQDAMVFDNGSIKCADLLNVLQANKNEKVRILLLSDACKSGPVWDIQSAVTREIHLTPNIIALSAAKDQKEDSKNLIGQNGQGLFTYFFCKAVAQNKVIPPSELEQQINQNLAKFRQHIVLETTDQALSGKPLFA